jgi:hypothetical protein
VAIKLIPKKGIKELAVVPENLEAFLMLIARYETVKPGEIRGMILRYGVGTLTRDVLVALTGFGGISTCLLCATNPESTCWSCIWFMLTGAKCNKDSKKHELNSVTYNAISDANSVRDLLTAYKRRALYMRQMLNKRYLKVSINEMVWEIKEKMEEKIMYLSNFSAIKCIQGDIIRQRIEVMLNPPGISKEVLEEACSKIRAKTYTIHAVNYRNEYGNNEVKVGITFWV